MKRRIFMCVLNEIIFFLAIALMLIGIFTDDINPIVFGGFYLIYARMGQSVRLRVGKELKVYEEDKWISVSEQFPPFGVDVLLNLGGEGIISGFAQRMSEDTVDWFANTGDDDYTDCEITPAYWKWMPGDTTRGEQ